MGKELKRMRYFDGLFLNAEDYTLDQDFYLRLQRLHNRYLHTWGIVCGLKVVPYEDSDKKPKVKVTEGLALNQVVVTDEATGKQESVSQEILIYDGHPDNPVDLSEYAANETYYIMVSYEETVDDRNNERGQGEEIHIWERGRILVSTDKPTDTSKILLAKIVPKVVGKSIVVDKDCIFEAEQVNDLATNQMVDKPLRVYAGAAGRKMVTEELVVRSKGEDDDIWDMSVNEDNLDGMPTLSADPDGKVLKVKADETEFSNDVKIKGDLSIEGELVLSSGDKSQSEMKIMNSFVEVNSPNWDDPDYEFPGPRDGGLEVYRGPQNQDARMVWVEKEQCWKVGMGTDLKKMAYGDDWDKLIKNQFADGMHKHSFLSSTGGLSFGFNDGGKLVADSDLAMKDNTTLWLKATDRSTIDSTHGLGWFGQGKPFADAVVDGPVLFGKSGGALGGVTVNSSGARTEQIVLSWNSGGDVGIGPKKTLADNLDVDGSMRILSGEGKNPIRFTSAWSGFPDDKNNGAEISNDTTNYKALMIVGNRSLGQGRKVAIWDRLDVNGFLFVKGKLQATEEIIPSTGSGSNNGIIFPADPGGGLSDRAWIKYYQRSGEQCNLEIGINNDDHITLNPSGNVGIGTLTPADKLDVYGGMRIMSDQNPIRFTSSWQSFANSQQAEISNDTSNYKTLMIVGNSSGGQGRKVSVWDRLDVNGHLQVNGNTQITGDLEIKGSIKTDVLKFAGQFDRLDVANYFTASIRCADLCIGYPGRRGALGRALVDSGSQLVLNYGNDWSSAAVHSSLQVTRAIIPSAGSGTNGIIFPSDPGGGSGDVAWIKYYPSGGENCILDIGVSNDRGDRIHLNASGGVYGTALYYLSSRELKENIADISTKEAKQLLESLNPVSFHYKGAKRERTLGFIAEEVPGQMADPDQQAVSPMDIIAVLTSVVKDQQKAMARMQKQIAALESA